MACSKCGKNGPIRRGRLTKPGTSLTGDLMPHNITKRQGPRKQLQDEEKRELRGVPKRNVTKLRKREKRR